MGTSHEEGEEMKCKCGCGLDIPRTGTHSTKVYFDSSHRILHKMKHPETRVGNYHNARKDSSPFYVPIVKLLEETNYPKYISRNDFSHDLEERGVTGYGMKDIRYHVAILLPTLGYKRRTKLSYERVENVVSN